MERSTILKSGAPYLIGCHITPLTTASTHVQPDPTRTRKLLLNAEELRRLIGKVERAGYALVPLDLHYRGGWIKLEIGLAKGKRKYDKRAKLAEKESKRRIERALKERERRGW